MMLIYKCIVNEIYIGNIKMNDLPKNLKKSQRFLFSIGLALIACCVFYYVFNANRMLIIYSGVIGFILVLMGIFPRNNNQRLIIRKWIIAIVLIVMPSVYVVAHLI